MSNIQVDENLARIQYILEIIEELNELLALRKENGTNRESYEKYEIMKREFHAELLDLVEELGPAVEIELELAA